jgi:hypothetical protein
VTSHSPRASEPQRDAPRDSADEDAQLDLNLAA